MPAHSTASQTESWNTALRYIAGRKAAEESLGFLAHISATVRQTTDPEAVGAAVAKACVPFFASAVALDTPARPAAVEGPDGSSAALEALRDLAADRGQRQLVVSTHEKLADRTVPDHLDLLRGWGLDSAAVLALEYRGVTSGHLVLVRDAKHRRGALAPSDLALAVEVADRIAAFNAFAARSAVPDGR